NFEQFEAAGVDQLIFLHQAGNYRNEHVCGSLELFAPNLLPGVKGRHAPPGPAKIKGPPPSIAGAGRRLPALGALEGVAGVEAYPVLASKRGVDVTQLAQGRSLEPAALWRLHVGVANSSSKA